MLTARFDQAFAFARELHLTQTRKGTSAPYISHLMAVSSLVLEDGGSEEEAIAALLHDAIEDQGDGYPGGRPALRREIASRFGRRVLEIVDACTDDDGFDKHAPATLEQVAEQWRVRKRAFVAHLERTADDGILRVACADKLHNVRSVLTDYHQLGQALWRRFRTRNPADQLWYYEELVRVLGARPGRLTEELRMAVAILRQRVLESVTAPDPAR